MREKFELTLMRNLEEYPQEKNSELDPYYEKIYIALKGMHLEDGTKHTNDRYYITRKKYRTVNRKGFFEYTLSYAQEPNLIDLLHIRLMTFQIIIQFNVILTRPM